MTDRLKCPICGGEMIGNIGSPICHYNQDCPIHDRSIPQEIYDLLERTRKALDKAKNGLKELKDIIACPPDISYEICVSMYADGVLQEITALEQKD